MSRFSRFCFKNVIWIAFFIIFIAGCESYDSYRKASQGSQGQSENRQRSSAQQAKRRLDKNEDIEKVPPSTTPQETTTDSSKTEAKAEVETEDSTTDQAVNESIKSNKPAYFLDKYEEQLKLMMGYKDEIKVLREELMEANNLIKKQQTDFETAKQESVKNAAKIQEMIILNGKLTGEFDGHIKELKEELAKFQKETKELKVKLLKSQITETKAKQDLVRIRTEYIMDKQKWEAEENN